MIFIAHRGNTVGINSHMENAPDYIDKAINDGFFSEVDIRKSDNPDMFIMGHDFGKYELPFAWFLDRKQKLFIHAKDLATLSYFSILDDAKEWNVFWHQEDAYTLTLSGLIWAYPGSILDHRCICVMPESVDNKILGMESCYGICSDNVATLRNAKRTTKEVIPYVKKLSK